jgi:PHS family inorganic phosphate transporter-like MFS transporter
LQAIGFGGKTPQTGHGAYLTLKNISIGNLILAVAGLIPGYWVSFLFIDSWGRRPIQLMGFTILTIIFLIMGM